jgi:hypothetical protein
MFYTIYKITNKVNGKFYIGAHQTENLDDSYMGSGHLIRYAIKKYGIISFSKETLFNFETKQEMFDKEREIVNEQFVSEKTNYNIKVGGNDGFLNSTPELESRRLAGLAKYQQSFNEKRQTDIEFNEQYVEDMAQRGKQGNLNKDAKRRNNPMFDQYCKDLTEKARIAANSEEAKQKRKETYAKIGHNQGEKNSQFGSMWITNGTKNKKIGKDEVIPECWNKGRKLKSTTDFITFGLI